MTVINSDNLVLGRLASDVAKRALLNEEIALVNCERIVITGSEKQIFASQKELSERKGKPTKGFFYQRRPDFFVRKAIKRMMPKNARGINAYKKVKCYIGVPESLKSAVFETVKHADASKIRNLKYITVGEICSHMGGKWQR